MKTNAKEIWANRVQAWKASGSTAKEYAVRHGISMWGLYKWSWRLGAEKYPKGIGRELSVPPAVEIVGATGLWGKHVGVEYEPYEVVVGDVRIVVPARFEAGSLTKLMDVLERR